VAGGEGRFLRFPEIPRYPPSAIKRRGAEEKLSRLGEKKGQSILAKGGLLRGGGGGGFHLVSRRERQSLYNGRSHREKPVPDGNSGGPKKREESQEGRKRIGSWGEENDYLSGGWGAKTVPKRDKKVLGGRGVKTFKGELSHLDLQKKKSSSGDRRNFAIRKKSEERRA